MSQSVAFDSQIDWDFLLKTLLAGEAIFFLGPNIARTPQNQGFRDAFVESLNIEENPLVSSYYAGDDLFLFPDARSKSKIYYQMKEFYQASFHHEVYEILSDLPFKLVINASPDRFLGRQLGEGNHSFAFFHKNDPGENIAQGSLAKPLVYNLVGSLEAEESLLLTQDDLYGFLQTMLSGKGIPESLKDSIFSARSLIFLGFRFDQWYVQLLLRLLKVQDIRSRFARYATEQEYNEDTLSICLDQFKIEFIRQGVPEFLRKIHQSCAEAGGLIKRNLAAPSQKAKVLQLAKEDKLEDGLDLLEDLLKKDEDPDVATELTMLQGRFYRLQKRIRKEMVTSEEAVVERNKIREAILELVEE
ncbi:MAG: SIR2 family protein [Bacteroidota bacterium]